MHVDAQTNIRKTTPDIFLELKIMTYMFLTIQTKVSLLLYS